MSVKENAAKRKVSEAPLRRWEKALNECLKSTPFPARHVLPNNDVCVSPSASAAPSCT